MVKGQYYEERFGLSKFLQGKLKNKSIFVKKIQYGVVNSQVQIYLEGYENDPKNVITVNLDMTLIPGHTNVYSTSVIEAIKRSINP
ncbi:hypothetical protein ABE67_23290 [Cytobacillus firmus]|uniref:hypothetical protein n=1 Tax=Cytobacillus firmus TaxID=1399 RepID=UPI0018CE37B0|nr:hypothetical protein [Cytobacillus firmus]MBG9452196.1 hypothetical protein [Cytobacillus firmus]